MLKKIVISVMMICMLTIPVLHVQAGLLDDLIEQGSDFGDSTSSVSGDSMGGVLSEFIEDDIKDVVWGVGNLIFAGITVILGVKYIWSSAEGKSQVMESLPTFVLAVVFFYLADPLFDFIIEVTGGVAGADDWRELSGNVIWVINTIVKYLALGGLIFMGVRYLLASAEGKASLKTNMGGLVIGVLFVFLSTNVVNFIIEMGSDIL